MCTLILGRGILEPRSLWIAANRDEDPRRPSDPPAVLLDHPRVAGGRDREAGGTWLAVRERRAVVAMLNRRDASRAGATAGDHEIDTRGAIDDRRPALPPSGGPPPTATTAGLRPTAAADGGDYPRPPTANPPAVERRSRGLLAFETATAIESRLGLAGAAIDHALRSMMAARYAPFSMVFATPDEGWVLTHDPAGAPRAVALGSGWHVITHADLDDGLEPRTAFLLADLRSWRPHDDAEIERGLIERLRRHAPPAVCIHDGRMVTVSSSLVHLATREARYLHAEGRPCESLFEDRSSLLDGAWAATPGSNR